MKGKAARIAMTAKEHRRSRPNVFGAEGSVYDIYFNMLEDGVELPDFPNPMNYRDYRSFELAALEWERGVYEKMQETGIVKLPEFVTDEGNFPFPMYVKKAAVSSRNDEASAQETSMVVELADETSSTENDDTLEKTPFDDISTPSLYTKEESWEAGLVPSAPVPEEFDRFEEFERAFRRWYLVVSESEATKIHHPKELENVCNLRMVPEVAETKQDQRSAMKRLEEVQEKRKRLHGGGDYRSILKKQISFRVGLQGEALKPKASFGGFGSMKRKRFGTFQAQEGVKGKLPIFDKIKSIILGATEIEPVVTGKVRVQHVSVYTEYPNSAISENFGPQFTNACLGDVLGETPPHSFRKIALGRPPEENFILCEEIQHLDAVFRATLQFTEDDHEEPDYSRITQVKMSREEYRDMCLLTDEVRFFGLEDNWGYRNLIEKRADLDFFAGYIRYSKSENFVYKLGLVAYSFVRSEVFDQLVPILVKIGAVESLYSLVFMLNEFTGGRVDVFTYKTVDGYVYEMFPDAPKFDRFLKFLLSEYYIEVLFQILSERLGINDGHGPIKNSLKSLMPPGISIQDVASALMKRLLSLKSQVRSLHTLFFLLRILKIHNQKLANILINKTDFPTYFIELSTSKYEFLLKDSDILWKGMARPSYIKAFTKFLFHGDEMPIQKFLAAGHRALLKGIADFIEQVRTQSKSGQIRGGKLRSQHRFQSSTHFKYSAEKKRRGFDWVTDTGILDRRVIQLMMSLIKNSLRNHKGSIEKVEVLSRILCHIVSVHSLVERSGSTKRKKKKANIFGTLKGRPKELDMLMEGNKDSAGYSSSDVLDLILILTLLKKTDFPEHSPESYYLKQTEVNLSRALLRLLKNRKLFLKVFDNRTFWNLLEGLAFNSENAHQNRIIWRVLVEVVVRNDETMKYLAKEKLLGRFFNFLKNPKSHLLVHQLNALHKLLNLSEDERERVDVLGKRPKRPYLARKEQIRTMLSDTKQLVSFLKKDKSFKVMANMKFKASINGGIEYVVICKVMFRQRNKHAAKYMQSIIRKNKIIQKHAKAFGE